MQTLDLWLWLRLVNSGNVKHACVSWKMKKHFNKEKLKNAALKRSKSTHNLNTC